MKNILPCPYCKIPRRFGEAGELILCSRTDGYGVEREGGDDLGIFEGDKSQDVVFFEK